MHEQIDKLLKSASLAVDSAADLRELDCIRTQFLGKKGSITTILKSLSGVPKAERAALGKVVNTAKKHLITLIESRAETLRAHFLESRLEKETLDVTLPSQSRRIGHMHPISRTLRTLVDLFTSSGFVVSEGPEIEDDYHNFEALNFSHNHPARAMHDTFYLKKAGYLLRTHTSTVQIRALKRMPLPLRIITPGTVYRRDSDHTHTPMFHQVEGLVVNTTCTFADLKGLLIHFLNQFFSRDLKIRFRPSYFPFTEPSAEVDIACIICQGKGCRVCKKTGWLEILGCGMVHPNVLTECAVDSEAYTGFAFGLGVDRLAMLRYGIPDLRKFFESDMRFLEQF